MKLSEHEKVAQVQDLSQACGEFLEWLESQGYVLARYHEHNAECYNDDDDDDLACDMSEDMVYPYRVRTETLLGHYFGIDLDKLEDEKRAILDEIQQKINA